MRRCSLRCVISTALAVALISCNSSDPDASATSVSTDSGQQSESSERSAADSSFEPVEYEGNGGKSLGDMRANAYARCVDLKGGDPAYEESCNAKADREIQAEGLVTDGQGREWSTLDNESGAVVTREDTRYYLGRSCDARSDDGLIGRWNKKDLDSFAVIFPDRRLEFKGSILGALDCLIEN